MSAGVPDDFTLHIPMRGVERRAKIVWREKRAMGVRFQDPPEAAGEPARQKDSLVAENARLKAQIRELTRRLENLGQDVSLDAWL